MNELVSCDDFLSKEECQILIDYHTSYDNNQEFYGHPDVPEDYSINTNLNHHLPKKVRKVRTRCLKELSQQFGQRIHHDIIALWPTGTEKPMHHDTFPDWSSGLSSICYLNDDFEGGETVVGDTIVEPKRGKIIAFDGLRILHGFKKTTGPRYTYIAWWQEN